jgi:DNA-directed RNA polymerase subunit RPC12/RpoP
MARFHVGSDGDIHEDDSAFETMAGLNSSPAVATSATRSLSSSDSTATPGKKICSACGKNVAGEKRFKDAEGRYWCYDCGIEDHIRKHPDEGIACPDCQGKFPPSQLMEFEGQRFCQTCTHKRKKQKKREEARIAAAAAEAAAQQLRYKLLIAGVVVFVLAAVGLAIWAIAG